MKKISNLLFSLCLSACSLLHVGNPLSAQSFNYNDRHVAEQLALITLPNAALASALTEFNSLSSSQQTFILPFLSGQQYTNLIQINQVASQQFMRRMYDSVRYDSLGLYCGQNCDQFKVWSAVGGGEAEQKNSYRARGFKLSNFNLVVGAQKPLNLCLFDSWLTIGAAGSYEADDFSFNKHRGWRYGHGHGNNWQAAIYYMWNNCRFYSFSATIVGSDCVRVKRPVRFIDFYSRARSKTYITQWTSYSEFGLNWDCNCFYVQPFAGIEYAFYRRHASSERRAGFFELHVRGKNVSATIGRFGVHLTSCLPCWGLYVSADAAWRTRFNFLQERIKVHFKEFGHEFRIKGVHQKPNGFEGALNVAKCFCDRWQAYVELAGEKWERYSAWNLSAGVNTSW